MAKKSISASEDEAQELSGLARKLGLGKIADSIAGLDEEDSDDDQEFDALAQHRPPSAMGYRAVTQTMNWMGASWGDE